MRLSASGRDFIVHLNYDFNPYDGGKCVTARVHEGACERLIENCETGNPTEGPCTKIAESGRAYCHPKDQFIRATGRKVALGRALRNMMMDKVMRTALWADYRTKAK